MQDIFNGALSTNAEEYVNDVGVLINTTVTYFCIFLTIVPTSLQN